MRLLSLVLGTAMPDIKRTTAVGAVFASINKIGMDDTPSRRDQGRGPGTRPSETIGTGIKNMTSTVDFRLLNEY